MCRLGFGFRRRQSAIADPVDEIVSLEVLHVCCSVPAGARFMKKVSNGSSLSKKPNRRPSIARPVAAIKEREQPPLFGALRKHGDDIHDIAVL